MSNERTHIDESGFIREQLYGGAESSWKRYAGLVLTRPGLLALLHYEIVTTLFGPLPGALGLALRKVFYPRLFKQVGRGAIFGRNIIVRHGGRITLGDGVVIDDNCLLDGRGAGDEEVLVGDRVMLNRGVTVQAKAGPIHIGADTSVGAGTVIVAQGGVYIAEKVSIAGGCFISGGQFETTKPEDGEQATERYTKGPIRMETGCRLGMAAVVLDGVHLGEGCSVGPGSVVMTDLPAGAVALGVPARNFASRMSKQ